MPGGISKATVFKIINRIDVNLLLIPLIISLFMVILFYYSRLKRINSFFNFKKEEKQDKKKKEKKKRKSSLDTTKEKLYMALLLRNKEKLHNPIFNSSLIGIFLVFLGFLYLNSLVLAILIPLIIYLFLSKIVDEMLVSFDVVVRKNFTILVNHIVKVFSTTNDLGIVLYESSKQMEEPLRSLILTLSREMMTDNSEQQLINFIEETDNLWLHSFIFTLVNYKEGSSKESVVNNLIKLSDMIEARNDVSEKMINERRPIVMLNYMLLVVGVAIFIMNLIMNPMMMSFLFTPTGTLCLIVGVSAALGTILMNIKLLKY